MPSGYQLADPENKQMTTAGGIVALGPVANNINQDRCLDCATGRPVQRPRAGLQQGVPCSLYLPQPPFWFLISTVQVPYLSS